MNKPITIHSGALALLAVLALGACNRDWDTGRAAYGGAESPATALGTVMTHDASGMGRFDGQRLTASQAGAAAGARAGFAALPDRGDLVDYPQQRVVRREGAYTWHRVDVSEEHALRAIVDGELRITTPDGQVLAFDYERHVEHPTGDWTWVGHLRDALPGRQAILTFGADAVYGSIAQAFSEPLSLAMRDGASWLMKTDPALLADVEGRVLRPEQPDFLLPPLYFDNAVAPKASGDTEPVGASGGDVESSSSTASSTTTVVDVLVGYTPGFATYHGGDSQARTRINFLVDVANQGYINSQIDARVRLVHAMAVNYPDATDNGDTLEKLTGYKSGEGKTAPDPAFSALRNARETYGADLVTLVRKFTDPENDGCGIAWLIGGGLTNITQGYEYFGYSVVGDGVDQGDDGKNYTCRDETMAHEWGHNMGSAHDVETAKGEDGVLDNPDDYGRYTYSFGYRTGAGTGDFYTIMAYREKRDSGTQQQPYRAFSNPDITFCGGFPCGTANADNARSLRQTMPIIAGFRSTVVHDQVDGVHNDTDGDGRTDLLWFKWGALEIWRIHGYTINSVAGYTPASDLFPYVTGEFNAHSGADIAWRDSSGRVIFWVTTPTGYVRAASEYAMGFGWRLQASGDRNGDGISDLIWRSAVDGRVMYWHMGPNQERLSYQAFVQDPAYEIVTTGDFNGDGKTDLFFRRRADGSTVVWLAQGSGYVTTSPGSISKYWVPVNSSDFDGDGDDDVIWRSQVDGRVLIWQIQNGLRANYVVFSSDTDRELLGSGDLNGDGLMDLVWRRSDGAVSTWLNVGGSFTSRYIGSINTTWKFVPGTR